MKTNELFDLLAQHTGKSLLFEYSPGRLVQANYHITEVKHMQIDSVDCGARTDAWKETIIQLWESPEELGKTEYMTVYKAMSILKRVGRMKPFEMDSEVKFEYGNDLFHTAQLFVNDYEINQKQLLLKLSVQPTDCKAKDVCGSPEPATVGADAGCDPASGCC